MYRLAIAIALPLAVLGCAKHPDSIAPTYVSHVPYQTWNCQQLSEEAIRLNQALAVSSGQQINARTNDTVGVIFLGLPVSSLSGDNVAPQIAAYKGSIDAVRTAANGKNCGLQIASIEPVMPPKKPTPTEWRGY